MTCFAMILRGSQADEGKIFSAGSKFMITHFEAMKTGERPQPRMPLFFPGENQGLG
jgi:hypothetical protein